jgi:hypothetical protein
MRVPEVVLLLAASLGLSGCNASSQSPPPRWTSGFWFWSGSSLDPAYSGEALDVLFVQVGTISLETLPRFVRQQNVVGRWNAFGSFPRQMPAARDYWMVYRYERQGVPDLQVVPLLSEQISRLREEARERDLHLVGVQFDIDSPTSALPQYAAFLREVRKTLPPGFEISITALLDWFRNGTAADELVSSVDEFVPQFYDIGNPAADGEATIAARIDAARWGPLFNRFRKRFRIGVSSFGRARVIPHETPAQARFSEIRFYGDLRPLDVATKPAFELQANRNQAGETVLNYRANRKVRLGYERLGAGDTVQFIISTPDAIRAAVQSAREIKGHNAGVVFFRWPGGRESWAMQPEEVLDAAGALVQRQRENRVHVVKGDCAAVRCVDVYLESARPLAPRAVRYRIHASTELEYFLPEQNVPVRLAGTTDLEVLLPPYCGRGRLYLGRAVSLENAEFTVEEEP